MMCKMMLSRNSARFLPFCKTIQFMFLILFFLLLTGTISEKEPVDDEPHLKTEDTSVNGNLLRDGNTASVKSLEQVNTGFIHGFLASLSVIIVSELGDKTFFIAAIMAMRHSRVTVFLGAISALGLMTVLSVWFGYLATYIPRQYTYYLSTALFAIFGLKMLSEGIKMSPTEGQEELEEVQTDLRKRDDEYEKDAAAALITDPESGMIRRAGKAGASMIALVSRVFVQSFTLTFLAEWGDRSQLATILLGAREDVYGVAIGGVLGHSLCTGLAVIGGRMIAQRISVRTVTIVGGITFLLFAIVSLLVEP